MTDPSPPSPKTASLASTLALAAGAVAGSLLVSAFQHQPAWVWGAGGGMTGGLAAAAAGWVLRRPWPLLPRLLLALLLLTGTFLGLFLLAGGLWITDPRSFQVRPPGS